MSLDVNNKTASLTVPNSNILSEIFSALSRRRFSGLLQLEPKESLSCVLPCICRCTLYPSATAPILPNDDRIKLRALLLEFTRTNTLVSFMGVDFAVLESDLRKELKLRKKTLNASSSGNHLETLFTTFSVAGIGHRFEAGDPSEKYRLLLSEILTTQLMVNEAKTKVPSDATTSSKARSNAGIVKQFKPFEPLDNEAYVGDCCDLLIMFLAERPDMISVEELCQLLVYYRNGPIIARSIIMNFPDRLSSTCHYLIDNFDFAFVGDERSLIQRQRMETLILLGSLDARVGAELSNHCMEKGKYRLAISIGLRFLPTEFIEPLVLACLAAVDDQQRSSLLAYVNSMQKGLQLNIPKTTKRSVVPEIDQFKTSLSTQDRVQYTEADETILDIIGQDSDTVVDLKRLRELWENEDDSQEIAESANNRGSRTVSPDVLSKALRESSRRPAMAISALRRILNSNRGSQRLYLDALTESFPYLLDPSVPLHVIQLAAKLWSKIEPLSPRRLYVLTIASLLPSPRIPRIPRHQRTSHVELCKDPLTILRCDERIFRCAPLLTLLLRTLRCYLAASRVYLQRELASATSASGSRRLPVGTNNPQAADVEKEELMRSLIGAQESAAVQILLEACLPQPSEEAQTSHLTSLREIRCVICSFIHQMFISDPILSKLVHFQTYPSELIEVTVAGIPSMHICLDFIPEMLSQPILSKRVFAIHLLSFLCEHYAIPKAFSIARLAINVLSTLIGVVSSEEVVGIFSGLTHSLCRINRVFPPLSSSISSLLRQVSRICQSRLTASDASSSAFTGFHSWGNLLDLRSTRSRESTLLFDINEAFRTELVE